MDRQPDSVQCGLCTQPFALDAIPAKCPKCGSTNRVYTVGQKRHYVMRIEPAHLTLTTYPPEVIISKTPPPSPPPVVADQDEVQDVVKVPYSVQKGADERTRLLARVNALIAAIEGIANGVGPDDFDKDLFIARTADLSAALGIVRGTKKDIADGRVTDGDAAPA